MGLLDFFFRRKKTTNQGIDSYNSIQDDYAQKNHLYDRYTAIMADIFATAHEGMQAFDYPGITKEGKFEVLMFDIWVGASLASVGRNIPNMDDQIDQYLLEVISELNLPKEKKYERVYLFRELENVWEEDMIGLSQSNYPQTKQYLPYNLYICMIKHPCIVFTEEGMIQEMLKISYTEVADFLMIFGKHYEWLIEKCNRY